MTSAQHRMQQTGQQETSKRDAIYTAKCVPCKECTCMRERRGRSAKEGGPGLDGTENGPGSPCEADAQSPGHDGMLSKTADNFH